MKTIKLLGLVALIIILSAVSTQAQEIRVKSFKKVESDLFARINERLDNNDTPCAVLKILTTGKDLQFSGMVVGQIIQQPGMVIVYVAPTTSKITIKHAEYGVLTYILPERAEKQTVYEVKLQLIESSRNKLRSIVMANLGYTESNMSYGIMLGLVKKGGGYIRGKWDFNNFSTDMECKSDGSMVEGGGMPWYSGETESMRLAVTAGYIQRLATPLYLYVGAGYGYRTLAWETVDGLMVKNVDHSYKGIEAEAGLILRMGGFAISAGVQSNSFEYMEANFGIGFMF